MPDRGNGQVTAIVQARMGSSRLPGKVLADVAGRPLLGFLLERLRSAPVDRVVVATSDAPGDDAVAAVATDFNVAVVRGPEADVLARFALALDAYPAASVIRITGDCPLSDPDIIGAAIDTHIRSGAAYTSNTLIRTYPDGLDVEVMSEAALRAAAAESTDPVEREHVTPFLYRRPERFKLASFRSGRLLGDERWTVDTASDLERIRRIVAGAKDPTRDHWEDFLAVAGVHNADVAPGAVRLLAPFTDRDDPGHRRWQVRLGARAVGTVDVAVVAGVGHVAMSLEPETLVGEVLRALQGALKADFQVTELWVPLALADESVAAAADFSRSRRGWRWRRV